MKRIIALVVCVFAFGTVAAAWADDVAVSKMALMTFEGAAQINAPAAKVWTALTDKDKAMSWCPMWKNAKSPQPLTKVGNTMEFVDDWKNAGKSVVIYVDAGKELRIAHVPDNGSYMCQAKIVLTPDGNTTHVKVTEQYSDAFDAPTDKDTAAMTQKEIAAMLAALKGAAEKM